MCSHIDHLVIKDIINDVMKNVEKRTDDNLLGLIDKTVSSWVFEEEKVCKGRDQKKNYFRKIFGKTNFSFDPFPIVLRLDPLM